MTNLESFVKRKLGSYNFNSAAQALVSSNASIFDLKVPNTSEEWKTVGDEDIVEHLLKGSNKQKSDLVDLVYGAMALEQFDPENHYAENGEIFGPKGHSLSHHMNWLSALNLLISYAETPTEALAFAVFVGSAMEKVTNSQPLLDASKEKMSLELYKLSLEWLSENGTTDEQRTDAAAKLSDIEKAQKEAKEEIAKMRDFEQTIKTAKNPVEALKAFFEGVKTFSKKQTSEVPGPVSA